MFGHCLMKRGVELGDLRERPARIFWQALIPIRLAGLCSGPSGMHSVMAAMTELVDQNAFEELLAAVYDAVSHGPDLI